MFSHKLDYFSEEEIEILEDLFEACETDNILLLQSAFERTPKRKRSFIADIELGSREVSTPLIQAIKNESLLCASILLSHGADVNKIVYAQNDDNTSPIYEAIYGGRHKSLAFILDNGADPNLVLRANSRWRETSTTPLLQAALYNDYESMRRLVDRGANVCMANGYGWTPLLAISRSIFEKEKQQCVEWLLNEGANIKDQNLIGDNVISLSINSSVDGAYLDYLFDKGGVLNEKSKEKSFSLLHKDSLATEALSVLIAHGFDINHVNSNGETLIIKAMNEFEKKTDAIFDLLKMGANVNISTEQHQSAFHILVKRHRTFNHDAALALAEMFIDHAGNLSACDNNQKTVCDIATEYRNEEFTRELQSLENDRLTRLIGNDAENECSFNF